VKVKNLTPFAFGPKVTSRRPPQRELVLAIRGAFELRPGEPLKVIDKPGRATRMSGETFREDDDERRGEALYPGDFADFKLRAEVMLRGTCHAPGARPVKECPVRFSVGGLSKLLRVVGPRVYSDGLLQGATEPKPFTSMSLDWSNAFGGPGFDDNPVGKGFGALLELPNVEAPGHPVSARGERHEPAGFGPVASTWPRRAQKVGKAYGAAWKKTNAPFYAEDFDWSYFSSAPDDQQLDGYLRGDEEVTFQNLHPTAPAFGVKLPALRVRAFVKDTRGDFRELAVALDTLFAEPDAERLYLTWRGHTPVREEDLADVAIALIAAEPLADAALPESHYRALLDAFEKDPLGKEALIRERFPEPLQERALAALRGDPFVPPPPPPGTPPARAVSDVLTGTGAVDPSHASAISGAIEQAIARAAPHGDLGAAMGRGLSAPATGGAALGPGGPPKVALGGAIEALKGKLGALKRATGAGGAAVFDRLEAVLADPRLAGVDAGSADATPPEPGPGVDCKGMDLSGRDLAGRDLSSLDLAGANLSGAKLVGARLVHANLRAASLASADLTDANLEAAVLTNANLSNANARGARLVAATFDRGFARKTTLAGAVIDEARMAELVVSDADWSRVSARRVRFRKVVFQRVNLEGADFGEAELVECYFLNCRARGLVARGALAHRTSFGASDLEGASFEGLRGERTIWKDARLAGADFSRAVLPSAFFIGVTGAAPRFFGANLLGARFYKARLERGDFTRANLMGADFSKAHIDGARFTDANLYDAKFLGSAGAATDFSGANLKRALFEQP
jgi:uncharacterized protein YjbI with pentapeptide repeats